MPAPSPATSCLALLLAVVGCTGDRPAQPAGPPPATPAEAAPREPPRADPAAPTPDPPAAPTSRIRQELGEAAVAVVEHATTVGAARMKVIGARQASEAALTADAGIGGYPIEAPLVALDTAARERLLRLVLDDASYDFETARRCANDYFVGVRFQREQARVEFNLGVRCMQAFWSLRDGGEIRQPGGLLTDQAADAVLGLLADAGVDGALELRSR